MFFQSPRAGKCFRRTESDKTCEKRESHSDPNLRLRSNLEWGHSVGGLFPIVRTRRELEQRAPGGERDECPIESYRESIGRKTFPAASSWRDDGQPGQNSVAREQAHRGNRRDHMVGGCTHQTGMEKNQPEQRIEQRRNHRSAEKELQGDEAEPSG